MCYTRPLKPCDNTTLCERIASVRSFLAEFRFPVHVHEFLCTLHRCTIRTQNCSIYMRHIPSHARMYTRGAHNRCTITHTYNARDIHRHIDTYTAHIHTYTTHANIQRERHTQTCIQTHTRHTYMYTYPLHAHTQTYTHVTTRIYECFMDKYQPA